ncbi:hypothetical protein CEXT_295201 [Caerostris extrusa]|uniref:Uncharacterized protein n=1 Tax=Caerostris extrusa TaxID=172846 RepID=A0AAV4RLR6_CAEEX|nr:hypothetical protein CEXT_295201 [Caerostris extrusa]
MRNPQSKSPESCDSHAFMMIIITMLSRANPSSSESTFLIDGMPEGNQLPLRPLPLSNANPEPVWVRASIQHHLGFFVCLLASEWSGTALVLGYASANPPLMLRCGCFNNSSV